MPTELSYYQFHAGSNTPLEELLNKLFKNNGVYTNEFVQQKLNENKEKLFKAIIVTYTQQVPINP